MSPANERRRYTVTPSLIGWAHTQKNPWRLLYEILDINHWHVVECHTFKIAVYFWFIFSKYIRYEWVKKENTAIWYESTRVIWDLIWNSPCIYICIHHLTLESNIKYKLLSSKAVKIFITNSLWSPSSLILQGNSLTWYFSWNWFGIMCIYSVVDPYIIMQYLLTGRNCPKVLFLIKSCFCGLCNDIICDMDLMASSHYLNQCWLVIKGVLWHSPESNFTRRGHKLYL